MILPIRLAVFPDLWWIFHCCSNFESTGATLSQRHRKDCNQTWFSGAIMTTYEFNDLNPFPDVSCCPFRALLSHQAQNEVKHRQVLRLGTVACKEPLSVESVRQKIQVFFLEAMWIILTLRKCLAFGGEFSRLYNCQSDNCTEQLASVSKMF